MKELSKVFFNDVDWRGRFHRLVPSMRSWGLDINNASLLLLDYDLNPSTRPLCNFRIN